MAKNPYGKRRDKSNPYAVYVGERYGMKFTWYVLKTYQAPEKAATDKYARAYCFVVSDACPTGEYGDTYFADIRGKLVSGEDVRGNGVGSVMADLGMSPVFGSDS